MGGFLWRMRPKIKSQIPDSAVREGRNLIAPLAQGDLPTGGNWENESANRWQIGIRRCQRVADGWLLDLDPEAGGGVEVESGFAFDVEALADEGSRVVGVGDVDGEGFGAEAGDHDVAASGGEGGLPVFGEDDVGLGGWVGLGGDAGDGGDVLKGFLEAGGEFAEAVAAAGGAGVEEAVRAGHAVGDEEVAVDLVEAAVGAFAVDEESEGVFFSGGGEVDGDAVFDEVGGEGGEADGGGTADEAEAVEGEFVAGTNDEVLAGGGAAGSEFRGQVVGVDLDGVLPGGKAVEGKSAVGVRDDAGNLLAGFVKDEKDGELEAGLGCVIAIVV